VGAVDAYARAHLFDGLGCTAFLAAVWVALPTGPDAAAGRLEAVAVAIAAAAVYVAGGKGGDIIVAVAVVGLFARFYGRLVVSVAPSVEAATPVNDPHPLQVVASGRGSDTLKSGDRLGDCEYLRSGTGRFRLVMIMAELQLWERGADTVTWNSATGGTGKGWAELDAEGKLVIRLEDGAVVWSSHLPGGGATRTVVADDGRILGVRDDATTAWVIAAPQPLGITAIAYL
jgi:hypothetical protein